MGLVSSGRCIVRDISADNLEAIGGNGGALRQALVSQKYPSGQVKWGGQTLPCTLQHYRQFWPGFKANECSIVNSMLLDVTGILFAGQLVLLLSIGPYADYGYWRPWIMISVSTLATPLRSSSSNHSFIVSQTVLYIAQFAMCGISRPDQWQAAQALYVVGSLGQFITQFQVATTVPPLTCKQPRTL